MPPEKSMGVISVEIEHLQHGQARIESGLEKLSGKLDNVGEVLTSFVRLAEKHDALSDRVAILEESSKDREVVVNRGESYMNATKYLFPLVLVFVGSYVGWLVTRVDGHDTKIHQIEINQVEKSK